MFSLPLSCQITLPSFGSRVCSDGNILCCGSRPNHLVGEVQKNKYMYSAYMLPTVTSKKAAFSNQRLKKSSPWHPTIACFKSWWLIGHWHPTSPVPGPQGPDVCVASHCFPKFSPFSRSCGCRMQGQNLPMEGSAVLRGLMVVHSTKMLTIFLYHLISNGEIWWNIMIHLWSLGVSPYNFYIFLVFVTPQVKATSSSPAVQHRPLAGALPGDTGPRSVGFGPKIFRPDSTECTQWLDPHWKRIKDEHSFIHSFIPSTSCSGSSWALPS